MCKGQKSALRALLCPQGQKKEKHRSLQKATTKEVAVPGGCFLGKVSGKSM